MKLDSLKTPLGLTKRTKRVGRGEGSGKGKTAGRGSKGYHSRTGSKRRAWFEGGQMPLQRRVPKRGFKNTRFRKIHQIVNLDRIAGLGLDEVDITIMVKNGLVKTKNKPVKVLGNGDLVKAVLVTANAFSKTAMEKIESSGGKAITK